jgi:hypothetical protein
VLEDALAMERVNLQDINEVRLGCSLVVSARSKLSAAVSVHEHGQLIKWRCGVCGLVD